MYRNIKVEIKSQQAGLSLVELIVALAIFGIVVGIGLALFNYPNQARGKNLTQIKIQERYSEAFNLFYRTYNQTYTQGGSTLNYVSSLEAVTSPVQIQFSATSATPSIANNIITIGNGDTSLNNLLSYYAIPSAATYENTSTSSMCMLTGNASGNTWNFRCPDSYSGIQSAFTNSPITQIPIAFIDGLICYVTSQSNNTLTIDQSQNNCTTTQFNSELSAFNNTWFFTLPRIIVYSSDKSFQQPIFESLLTPRTRFTTNNNNYPLSY